MYIVYIHYNVDNQDERYDSFDTHEEAMQAINALLKDDEENVKNGVPVTDCSYGIRKIS